MVTRSSGHDFNKSGKLSISWTSFAAITKPIPRRQIRYRHDTYERLISSNTLTAARRMAHPQSSGQAGATQRRRKALQLILEHGPGWNASSMV